MHELIMNGPLNCITWLGEATVLFFMIYYGSLILDKIKELKERRSKKEIIDIDKYTKDLLERNGERVNQRYN